MVTPRLIKPIRVQVAVFPTVGEEQDDDWGTPKRSTAEILADPKTPKVIVRAQVNFTMFEELVPVSTGSNEDTDGYLLITEKDQRLHQFKPNDHVIRLLGRIPRCVQLRVTQVRPAAQRTSFGLYRIDFKDDSRGEP